MKCNFGVLYICLGHLGLSRKQLGKKTWSEDILRGKRKKNWRRNVDEFNMRWCKKSLLPNNLTMRDSFPLLKPFMETGWRAWRRLCLSFLLLTHRYKRGWKCRLCTDHTGGYDMLIHTCVMATLPPFIPDTYLRFHTTQRSYKASHV